MAAKPKPTKFKDDSIRVRLSKLNKSAACQRFKVGYDKLEGTERSDHLVTTLHMGQMVQELGLMKELEFLDSAKWVKSSQEERLVLLLDVLRLSGKLDQPCDVTGPANSKPVININEVPPAPQSEELKTTEAKTLPVVETAPTAPPAKPVSDAPVTQNETAPVGADITTEDGATFITEEATTTKVKLPNNLKGLMGQGS